MVSTASKTTAKHCSQLARLCTGLLLIIQNACISRVATYTVESGNVRQCTITGASAAH